MGILKGESVSHLRKESRSVIAQRRVKKNVMWGNEIAEPRRNIKYKGTSHGHPSNCFQYNIEAFNFLKRTSKDRMLSQRDYAYNCSS